MFIKFGDKTERVVVENSTNDNTSDDENDDDNEKELEDKLYNRRAKLLERYKKKNYTKISNN